MADDSPTGMEQHPPTIYLSPHLDDAVLSCGGRIANQVRAGHPARIVTVFAGEPLLREGSAPSRELMTLGAASQVSVGERRLEDERACSLLGAEYAHWSFLEAAYRLDPSTGRALYRNQAELFGAPHPQDEGLLEDVAAQLRELPPKACIVAPLGIGGHVDHVITRRSAERVWGRELAYYEDFPYAQKWGALSRALRPRTCWRSKAIRLTAQDIELKCQAIAQHASQAWILFKDYPDMKRKVARYAFRRRGECYWQRSG
jgi:LmbE family N-acetylglucosaminyl deacetylase